MFRAHRFFLLMLGLLAFVPVIASAALGLLALAFGAGQPLTRIIGTIVFVTAAYLQFFSPYELPGILLQTGLALTLEFWRRSL